MCEGRELQNVWSYLYLGANFSANGNHLTDVIARIAQAMKTAGKMRHSHLGLNGNSAAPEVEDLHCWRVLTADLRVGSLAP